jgi:hypothetical protein
MQAWPTNGLPQSESLPKPMKAISDISLIGIVRPDDYGQRAQVQFGLLDRSEIGKLDYHSLLQSATLKPRELYYSRP